jgi:pimeloyl-ACP methyl ester carboxylesterase
VLNVGGRDDELVPTVNRELLHERLPRSRLHLLPAGHYSWEEVPDLYGDTVLGWLRGGHRDLPTRADGGSASTVPSIASEGR